MLAAVPEEEVEEVEEAVDEEDVDPVDDVVEVDDVPVLDVLVVLLEGLFRKARRRSDRLPCNRGEVSEAKFSAAVTPDSRKVVSTGPEITEAVRIVSPGSLADSLVL